jgi:hypothetical protein
VQDEARAADQSAGGLKAVLAHPERELAEAREREAATTEILKIISSSPGNLQPVFDAIAQSAARLLRAHSANVTRIVGDEIHLAAFTAGSEEAIKAVQASFPSPMSSTSETIATAPMIAADALNSCQRLNPIVNPPKLHPRSGSARPAPFFQISAHRCEHCKS